MESASDWHERGPIPSVIDRYYTKYYAIDVKGRANNDHLILQHSNRVMLICIAPSHPLLDKKKGVVINNVEFQIGRLDRSSNAVSGKFKRGGQKLTPTSPLCIVHGSSDDEKYVIYSCIKGTLIEVNERLLTEPHLLQTHSDSDGYVATILPNKLSDSETLTEHLLTSEQYLASRQSLKVDNVTSAPQK